jgi:hypothetical protein
MQMKAMVMAAAAMALTGCSTVRFGAELTQGCQGPDGLMATVRIGAPAPCAAEPVPAADPNNPPGTWAGRQLRAAADWSTEHPGWAAFIAGATALVAAGEAQDWWGLFDGDDDGGGGKTPAQAEDTELDVNVKGNENRGDVNYIYGGDGARPNVRVNLEGDRNNVQVTVKPAEE